MALAHALTLLFFSGSLVLVIGSTGNDTASNPPPLSTTTTTTTTSVQPPESQSPPMHHVLLDLSKFFLIPNLNRTTMPSMIEALTSGGGVSQLLGASTGPRKCLEGTEYNITNLQKLWEKRDELECIFAAGKSPTTIGLGQYYGTVLLVLNSVLPSWVTAAVYQGDHVVRTRHNGRDAYMGTIYIAGIDIATAEWKLGVLPGDVAPGEYYDGRPSLVMDYREDPYDANPVEDASSPYAIRGFFPFTSPITPVNAFVDLGRVVGRDEKDNGVLFLNKAMLADSKNGYATVMYYALKNFDSRVNPDFTPGSSIKVPETFTYTREGTSAILSRLRTILDSGKKSVLTALRHNTQETLFGHFVPQSVLGLVDAGTRWTSSLSFPSFPLMRGSTADVVAADP